jgi:hypothetical protein
MKYTIKIAKTDYHSGRLLIAFSPIDPRFPTPLMSIGNSAYTHRMIVDVRETNEISFTIPFISEAPYLKKGDDVGIFYIFVMDVLKAPEIVSPDIELLCEVSGGEDLEWFGPTSFADIPYYPSAPQMAPFDPCATVDQVIGGASQVQQDFAQFCPGERVNSFRELSKVYNFISPKTGAASTQALNLIPYMANVCNYGGASIVSLPAYRTDLYTHLASIFLLSRGSVKFRFIRDYNAVSGSTDHYKYTVASEVLDGSATPVQFLANATVHRDLLRLRGMSIQSPDVTGAIEFLVPSYNRYVSRVNSEQLWRSGGTLLSSVHGPDISVYMESNTLSLPISSFNVLRSCAEDIDFGGFISIPPMYNPGTS